MIGIDARARTAWPLMLLILASAPAALLGCDDVGDVGKLGAAPAAAGGGAGAGDEGGAGAAGASDEGGAGEPDEAEPPEPEPPEDEPEDPPVDEDECEVDELPCQSCADGSACPDDLQCLDRLCRECLEDVDCGSEGACDHGSCEDEDSEEL